MPMIAPVLRADLDLELVSGDGLDVAAEDESDCRDAVRMDAVAVVDANVGLVSRSYLRRFGHAQLGPEALMVPTERCILTGTGGGLRRYRGC